MVTQEESVSSVTSVGPTAVTDHNSGFSACESILLYIEQWWWILLLIAFGVVLMILVITQLALLILYMQYVFRLIYLFIHVVRLIISLAYLPIHFSCMVGLHNWRARPQKNIYGSRRTIGLAVNHRPSLLSCCSLNSLECLACKVFIYNIITIYFNFSATAKIQN